MAGATGLEPAASAVTGVLSRNQNLTVGLCAGGKCLSRSSEVGDHLATDAEGRIERAIAVVACHCEIGTKVNDSHAHRDDLPVGLEGQCTHEVKVAEGRFYFATSTEGAVERAIAA